MQFCYANEQTFELPNYHMSPVPLFSLVVGFVLVCQFIFDAKGGVNFKLFLAISVLVLYEVV